MPNVKAVVDFSGYPADELGTIALHIHEKLTENTADFPDKPVSLADLGDAITDYTDKNAARASGADADQLAFNASRAQLEEYLYDWGNQVNITANGDPIIVEKSGFPSYETTRVVDYAPPAAPSDPRVRQGEVSGMVVFRFKPAKQRSTNQVQKCIGDPNVEANWTDAGFFQGGKATITGIVPGTVLWLRARTVGLKGVMGEWSDPVKIMVV